MMKFIKGLKKSIQQDSFSFLFDAQCAVRLDVGINDDGVYIDGRIVVHDECHNVSKYILINEMTLEVFNNDDDYILIVDFDDVLHGEVFINILRRNDI